MDFNLDSKYLEIQREARELAQSIEHLAIEADACNEIHPGILDALRSSKLSEFMVPTEYGGRFERVDPLAICVVREVLMATSSHLDSLFALQGIGQGEAVKGVMMVVTLCVERLKAGADLLDQRMTALCLVCARIAMSNPEIRYEQVISASERRRVDFNAAVIM